MGRFRLPKWAVVWAAASFFLLQAADWCAPTMGLHLAACWLGVNDADLHLFPLWGFFVRLAGADIVRLTWVSVWSAMLVVTCLMSAFGDLLAFAIQRMNETALEGEEGEYAYTEATALLLSTAAFVFTPGFLVAATSISPLMTVFLPPAAALALAMRVVCGDPRNYRWYGLGTGSLTGRVKAGVKPLALAALMLFVSAHELVRGGRTFLSLAFPGAAVYFVLGVMPLLIVAWCIRRRWLVRKRAQVIVFSAWGLAVAVLAAVAFTSGGLNEGRTASRVVARIVANAADKAALVSEGPLDDLFAFMLPRDKRLIQLARNRDPAYGRTLARWVEETGCAFCPGVTNRLEDLVFAAELGPRPFVDEWAKIDREGFERTVATPAFYFATRQLWEEACDELKNVESDDLSAEHLRWLLGACGNHLGSRLLEAGDLKGAWAVFWRIFDKVDRKNYVAVVNLLGMVERGYPAVVDAVEAVKNRRLEIEGRLKSREKMAWSVETGGRVYLSPETQEQLAKERRVALKKYGETPKAKAFLETVSSAMKDPFHGEAARTAIRKAIGEGWARADVFASRLAVIDVALQDFENAEKDAFAALLANPHDPVANAIIGSLNCTRGDFAAAERYLRRTMATGKASPGAKNDLAYTLMRLRRFDEAEPLARDAIKSAEGVWIFRETLAAILLRKGEVEEGERELECARKLAKTDGVDVNKLASFVLDQGFLCKAKDDVYGLKVVLRELSGWKGLKPDQREDIERLRR